MFIFAPMPESRYLLAFPFWPASPNTAGDDPRRVWATPPGRNRLISGLTTFHYATLFLSEVPSISPSLYRSELPLLQFISRGRDSCSGLVFACSAFWTAI